MTPGEAPLWQLAPGVRVVRRGLDRLQVGLHPARRVLLPRTPPVRRTLADLLALVPPDPEDVPAQDLLAELGAAGVLVPREDADLRARRRTTGRVAVRGAVPGVDVAAAVRRAGARLTRFEGDADVVLVLVPGEADRDDLDVLIRRRTDHLVVRLVDGGAVLGPFVSPGVTACLRCVDAHLSLADPDHTAVTLRYAAATRVPRSDGVADLEDPALLAVVAAWAARDVVARLEGREPATWSRTLRLGTDPADREEQEWLRHPLCGCCWAADDRPSGTMEA